MLLAGIVMGKLTLRDTRGQTSPPRLSLDNLVDESRAARLRDFALVAIVYAHPDGDVVLGFNSPHTLLCPVPTQPSDEARERAWGKLWQALTGSQLPGDWRTEAIAEWRYASNAVRQIRAWIEIEKNARGGTAPPWAHVFEHESAPPSAPFGRGRTVSVYWGANAQAPCVRIALPTAESGNYWPDEGTPRITEDELLAQVHALRTLGTEAGVTFQMAKFELPDRDAPLRAFWREHLEYLQQSGGIAAFGAESDGRRVAFLTTDRRSAAILDNVIVLDRDDIMVRDCSPMRQQPVPGSSITDGRIRYPDYPLRSDYVGLVKTEDGRRVLDLLKRGEQVRATPPAIDDGRRRQSPKATWNLSLAGRSDVLPITLSVPPADDEHHRAHWMVWPRFRCREAPFWRAYYVYEHCTDSRLHVIKLEPLPRRHESVKLGLDFGTSHTVASVQADGEKSLVELRPELPPTGDALTLHVSENWAHVKDAFKDFGLQALDIWLPTYTDEAVPKESVGFAPFGIVDHSAVGESDRR